MFVSGFTIARNVEKADYPIREAVYSILPLCDEVIIAVGKSEDNTLEYIRSFDSPKIRIIETIWDDNLRDGGKVLSIETNKALDAVNPKSDWCFYIQADECLHEKYIDNIRTSMLKYLDDKRTEGFLFTYVHFYGSYDYVADSRNWYRNEIRIIRNDPKIRSFKDAQGFRIYKRKMNVRLLQASIFHYGWVKHPEQQLAKLKQARKFWHSDEFLEREYANAESFDFSHVDSLSKFLSTHPGIMNERIKQKNWDFEHDISVKNLNLKKRVLYFIEKLSGWRVGENKNYRIIR